MVWFPMARILTFGHGKARRGVLTPQAAGAAASSGGNVPVLAICRGMQLFNVTHAGGTLVQDVEGHKLPRNGTHHIEIYHGTKLAEIFGAGLHSVNSRHHQAVARVGEGLTVSAKSPGGVVEGLERPDLRFAVAVQWHPEDQMPQQRCPFGLPRRL